MRWKYKTEVLKFYVSLLFDIFKIVKIVSSPFTSKIFVPINWDYYDGN